MGELGVIGKDKTVRMATVLDCNLTFCNLHLENCYERLGHGMMAYIASGEWGAGSLSG